MQTLVFQNLYRFQNLKLRKSKKMVTNHISTLQESLAKN